jgi:hypothetical protein
MSEGKLRVCVLFFFLGNGQAVYGSGCDVVVVVVVVVVGYLEGIDVKERDGARMGR